MAIKFSSFNKDRGVFWSAKSGDALVGAFGYTFLPSNDGTAFSRNHGNGYTTAWFTLVNADGTEVTTEEVLRGARFRKDADRLARVWFRQRNVRAVIRQHADGN